MTDDPLFNVHDFTESPDRGRYVYHYTKLDVAASFILGGDRQLRLGRAKTMNDPLEHDTRRRILGFAGNHLVPDQIDLFSRAIDTAARENVRIFSATFDRPSIVVDHPNGPIVTSPLLRGLSHPAMWAHYAENHSGVCLVFDRKKLDSRILAAANSLAVRSGEVEYQPWLNFALAKAKATLDADTRPETAESWANRQILGLWEQLYLKKHEDWSYENEFRWLVIGKSPSDFFVQLKGSELAAVIVGSECAPSNHAHVETLSKEWSAAARVMMWSDGTANALWPLSNEADPPHIKEYWASKEHDLLSSR